jgi:CRP/FNR family nitrogen fixation transcriptional regulator
MPTNTARVLCAPAEVDDVRRPAPPTIWALKPAGVARHLDRLRDQGMRLRFHRNEMIFQERDPATQIYSVAAGCVRLCRHVPDGRRHISDFMLPGDIFGFGEYQGYPFAAEAVNSVTLVAFPRSAFERLGEGNPGLRADLMVHYSMLLMRTQQHLFTASCQSARERMASFVQHMSQEERLVYGDRIDIPMSRQEIADYLGLTIETVCRVLAAMRNDGILEIPNAHQLVVKRPDMLRAIAEGRSTH